MLEPEQAEKEKRPKDGPPEDGRGSPQEIPVRPRCHHTIYRTEDASRRRNAPVLLRVVVRRLGTSDSFLWSFFLGSGLKKSFRLKSLVMFLVQLT